MPNAAQRDRIEQIVDEVILNLYERLEREFPELPTGDVPVGAGFQLEEALRVYMRGYVDINQAKEPLVELAEACLEEERCPIKSS